jgi:hypothetical protein
MAAFGGTTGTILLLAACSASFNFALGFLNYKRL